jgi:DNA-directed RNA polymerase subunit M/transcription elongation factor TFIIS
MYYLKIQDEEGNIGDTLIYYCRNCGHEDTTLNTTNICVSDMQLLTSEKKYTHIVNEYTKFDPTLPRINTIKCPNQECSSNVLSTSAGAGGGGAGTGTGTKKTAKTATAKQSRAKKTDILPTLEEEVAKPATAAHAASALEEKTHLEMENNREVIYIRYDDTNMKYVYLCVHCDTTWRTDNRL